MYSYRRTSLEQAQKAVQRLSGALQLRVVTDVVKVLTDDVDSLKITGALRARDYSKVFAIAEHLEAQQYPSAHQHFVGAQIAALVKKFPFDGLAASAEEAAWAKFRRFERRCHWMNLLQRRRETTWNPHESAFSQMRAWIRYVIGNQPDLASIWDKSSFGPGASVGVTGDATNFARKLLAKKVSVTPSASAYAFAAMKSNFHALEALVCRDSEYLLPCDAGQYDVRAVLGDRLAYVDYNKITFVPKTAKTYRSIAIEPTLNGFVQKGIDMYLRQRLLRVGIDLSDQTRNQHLAYLGSKDHDSTDPYCTIDLSSASDSISRELVRSLLPPDWFYLLDKTRSHNYLYKGQKHPYEKFVSMGNGFCFPLQTLIFASICKTAYAEINAIPDFSVYGDDIICRKSVVQRVLELIRACGFVPNRDKTFVSGPFRESCGKDYFGGKDVRPIYLDYKLDSIQNVMKFHNALASLDHGFDFSHILQYLRDAVPEQFRFVRARKGPPDSAFQVTHDVLMGSKHTSFNRSLWAWQWHEFVTRAVTDKIVASGRLGNTCLMIAALHGGTSEAPFTFRRKATRTVRMVSHDADGFDALPVRRTTFAGCEGVVAQMGR